MTISSTYSHSDNLMVLHSYIGTCYAIHIIQEVRMKTIVVKTKKINDKTIKALEVLGYNVIVILK